MQEILDKWLGTKYLHGGKTKYGVDCANFIGLVLVETGKLNKINEVDFYASDWFWHSEKEIILDNLFAHEKNFNGILTELKEFDGKGLMTGDLLLFKCNKSNRINHVGIYYNTLQFVHCIEYLGVIKDNLFPFWFNKLSRVFRIV